MCSLEKSYKYMHKILILKIWEGPLYEITEYVFKCAFLLKVIMSYTAIINPKSDR